MDKKHALEDPYPFCFEVCVMIWTSLLSESEEERTTMLRALLQSESLFSRYYLNEDFNDIKFDFELRDDIVIGQPFS